MGASLLVPSVEAGPWPGALARLTEAGLRLIALTPDPEAPALADTATTGGAVALLVGAEGDGLTADALAAAPERARIPTARHVDSLNVATAAAIALYHFASPPAARPR